MRVFVDDTGRIDSMGSGAYIAPGIVVTNEHVVRDRKEDRVEVLFPDWQHMGGEVILVIKHPDIAIIKLDKLPLDVKPFISGPLAKGQPLAIQGYGGGIWKQSWGTLCDKIYVDSDYKEVSDAFARNGDSGGPIVDARGRYIGTLWGSNDTGTYFTPAEVIFKLAGIKNTINYPPVILRD